MLCMHSMQPYTNLYMFCSMSLCIYAMQAFYAALYKLVYILLYESIANASMLCNMHASYVINKYIKFMICFHIYVYASMLCMHPMQPFIKFL